MSEEEKPEQESKWSTRALKRGDDWLEKYDRCRRRFSQWIGAHVYTALSIMETASERGVLFRRLKNWVSTEYYNRTHSNRRFSTPGRYFDDISSRKGIFLNTFHFRFYPYTMILLLIGTVAFLHFKGNCSISPPHLQVYGYLFNIVGTFILARGIFRGERGLMLSARDSREFVNHDEVLTDEPVEMDYETLALAAYNAVDAVWGAFYVILGFGLQIVVTLNWIIPIPQIVC